VVATRLAPRSAVDEHTVHSRVIDLQWLGHALCRVLRCVTAALAGRIVDMCTVPRAPQRLHMSERASAAGIGGMSR
jgi:hypothetical protein